MIRTTGLAALATLIALAVTSPASANQWYIESTRKHGRRAHLGVGEEALVPIVGSFTLKLKDDRRHLTAVLDCDVTGEDRVSNLTATEAHDELDNLTFACNGKRNTVTMLVPWSGTLESNGQPFLLPESGAMVEVVAGGVNYGVFTGTVTAKYADFDPPYVFPTGTEPQRFDDIDDDFKFNGSSGALSNGLGGKLAWAGLVRYGTRASIAWTARATASRTSLAAAATPMSCSRRR